MFDSVGPRARGRADARFLPARISRPGPFFAIFAVAFVLAVYVDLPTSRQGIPMISAFPFACVAAFIFLPSLVSLRVFWLFMFATVIFGISLLAPERGAMFSARLLAAGQFFYSLFISLMLFFTVKEFSAAQITSFARWFLFVLIVIMILEIFTPLSRIMDDLIYPFYGFDQIGTIINNRDLTIGNGFRRPKAFTSETSHVALAYTIGVCILAWLSHRHKSLREPAILAAIGVVVIRSPLVLFAVAFVGYCVWRRAYALSTDKADLWSKALRYGLLAIPVVALAGYAALGIFATRLGQIGSGDDYSTTYRTYGSLLVAWATLKEFPLFGVGIGSIDLAKQPITQTYIALGVPTKAVMAEWRTQIQNLPSALLIYLGGVGTLFYCLFMRTYFVRVAGRVSRFFWICLIFLSATLSAFYTPAFNTYLFLLLAVNLAWNRETSRRGVTPRDRLRPGTAAIARSRRATDTVEPSLPASFAGTGRG